MTTDAIREGFPPAAVPVVRCGVCGRGEVCAPEDLLRYIRHGWPRCCGNVMTYAAESGRPPDASGGDFPPRPGRV